MNPRSSGKFTEIELAGRQARAKPIWGACIKHAPDMPQKWGVSIPTLAPRKKMQIKLLASRMDRIQATVTDWLLAMIEKHSLTPSGWSLQAGLGKNTVSRALSPDYENVTTVKTLSKLAGALGEPPPIGCTTYIPSAESLVEIVQAIVEFAGGARTLDDKIALALAEGVRATLLHLAEDAASADDPRLTRSLVRLSMKQLRLAN